MFLLLWARHVGLQERDPITEREGMFCEAALYVEAG